MQRAEPVTVVLNEPATHSAAKKKIGGTKELGKKCKKRSPNYRALPESEKSPTLNACVCQGTRDAGQGNGRDCHPPGQRLCHHLHPAKSHSAAGTTGLVAPAPGRPHPVPTSAHLGRRENRSPDPGWLAGGEAAGGEAAGEAAEGALTSKEP